MNQSKTTKLYARPSGGKCRRNIEASARQMERMDKVRSDLGELVGQPLSFNCVVNYAFAALEDRLMDRLAHMPLEEVRQMERAGIFEHVRR